MGKSDILIIGAGATGLIAGYRLVTGGKKVTILEARNRVGGRIHTIKNELFFKQAELGAEFVHGDLPVTLNLLQEAGIAYSQAGGSMIRYADGRFYEDEQFMEQWGLLLKKLNELEKDTTLTGFLREHFSGDDYEKLRSWVIRYVSGYDTADPGLVSVFSLRDEWQHEDEDAQHRIDSGYGKLMGYLADRIKEKNGNIYLNSVVKEINWKPGDVKVMTDSGIVFSAKQLLIAMPLGVLQADEGEKGTIAFHPAIKAQTDTFKTMGFGAIVKFYWNLMSYFGRVMPLATWQQKV